MDRQFRNRPILLPGGVVGGVPLPLGRRERTPALPARLEDGPGAVHPGRDRLGGDLDQFHDRLNVLDRAGEELFGAVGDLAEALDRVLPLGVVTAAAAQVTDRRIERAGDSGYAQLLADLQDREEVIDGRLAFGGLRLLAHARPDVRVQHIGAARPQHAHSLGGSVAGKGMPAALFMALSRSLLLAEARRSLSPSEALHNVNRLLWELSRQQTFVTVFYAVLDTHTRQLTYSRAGHERPMLLRGGQIQPLPGDGVALGVFEDISIETTRLDLQSGDRLVLYTDGLTDVLSPSEERYELQRLKELFQAYASLPADQLCSLVFDSLAEYQGGIEQYDDMTMLILEVH